MSAGLPQGQEKSGKKMTKVKKTWGFLKKVRKLKKKLI